MNIQQQRELRSDLLFDARFVRLYSHNAEFRVGVDSIIQLLPTVLHVLADQAEKNDRQRQEAEEVLKHGPRLGFLAWQYDG